MERITKIFLLTMLLTLSITSTCFASYNNGELTDKQISAIQNWIATEYAGTQYAGNAYWLSRYQTSNVRIDIHDKSTLVGKFNSNNDGIELTSASRRYVSLSTDANGNIIVTKKDGGDGASFQTAWISSSNNLRLYYSSTNFFDTDGNQIFPELPEPDIPDIPAISLPNSDKSKNYYFMYVNNSGSTGLAVFSSDNEIIFDAVADNNAAYIDFTFTSPMNYSNYVLRDNEWIILENAKYDEAGTKNVNIGHKTIISSSFNVYSENGTIFFPVTPLLEEIAGAGLTEMWGTIMKAIMVILIIAVSLLALWISLVVLLKVLRTYLT